MRKLLIAFVAGAAAVVFGLLVLLGSRPSSASENGARTRPEFVWDLVEPLRGLEVDVKKELHLSFGDNHSAQCGIAYGELAPPTDSEDVVSTEEAVELLQRYEAAYRAESAAGMTLLLAHDANRRSTDGCVQRGREETVAAYAQHFAHAPVDDYRLEELEVFPGLVAVIQGRWSSERAGTHSDGTIRFAVIRQDGEPRIALIEAELDG